MVDKLSSMSELITLSGVLRERTSMLHPSILFEVRAYPSESSVADSDDQIVTDSSSNVVSVSIIISTVNNANYAYIPSFGRYYFVRDIVQENARMIRIDMDVDPLMSFSSYIYSLDALISRNESVYSRNQPDPLLPLSSVPITYEYEFPQDDVFINPKGEEVKANDGGRYGYIGFTALDVGSSKKPRALLSVINSSDDFEYADETIDVYSWSHGQNFRGFNLMPDSATAVYALSFDQASRFAKYITGSQYSTKIGFVKNLLYLPYAITDAEIIGKENPIYLGDYPVIPIGDWTERPDAKNAVTGYAVGAPVSQPILNAGITHIGLNRYTGTMNEIQVSKFPNWLCYEPYCKTEVYIPFYGWIDFPMNGRLGDSIALVYSVNYQTGDGNCYLYDVTKQEMVFQNGCVLGVKVQLDSTNAQIAKVSEISGEISMLGGMVDSMAQFIGGVAGGNPMGVLGGVKKLGSTFGNALVSMQSVQAQRSAHAGASDGVGWYYLGGLRPRIRYTFHKPLVTYDDNNYRKQHGLPYRSEQVLDIMRHTGFTQVASVRLEGIADATKDEVDAIGRQLRDGVIL